MKIFTKQTMTMLLALMLFASVPAFAANYETSNVGANGYDLVSYFQDGKAMRGTGWHAATHEGTTYLFSSKKNRKLFVKSPEKYLPQFGGYCAYGVAVGKKFYADPTVWKIVDGKLYLNLDQKIQKKWEGELSENLKKGYDNWPSVQKSDPAGI